MPERIKNLGFLKVYGIAVIAFSAIFLFTVFVFITTKSRDDQRKRELFANRVSLAEEALRQRITDYIQVLKAARALFQASDSVTAGEWRQFYLTIEIEQNFPGLQGLGYAVWIRPGDLEKHEKLIRSRGFPDYKVHPAFPRKQYTSIIYLEPFQGRNLRAFGYDMFSDPVRREAMEKAVELNAPAISGKVQLVQETGVDNQPGFLVYLPVFNYPSPQTLTERKNNIRGFVYNPFRSYDLFKNVFQGFEDLDIELYDSTKHHESLLFDSFINRGYEPEYLQDRKIDIAGANWYLHIKSKMDFGAMPIENEPYMILLLGLAISLVLALLIGMVSRLRMKAEILSNAKDEFIGIASHELKTPLTTIKAYVQLVKRSAEEERVSKNFKGFILKSEKYIRNLDILIGDLLDVSRIQAGKLLFNFEDFDPDQLVKDCVEKFQLTSIHHSISIKGKIGRMVFGDRQRIEQVLDNFLSNAIKYSPNVNEVLVEVKVENNQAVFCVRDFGPGIPEEKQEHIFEKFYRVDDASKFSGLGLGLYISGEIVRRHNGKIGVKSKAGTGSTFYFTLPLDPSVVRKAK